MTSPASKVTPPPNSNESSLPPSNGFGAAKPPDHRTTALQSAVSILRLRPATKTEDVLAMADAFRLFLEAGQKAPRPLGF